mmetsp:Transcript_10746/g.14487  ORF Transcript_10746/g.14487 Transcript_10746/m.14487 type:complete len:203 (+) Transcript_10746:111-719(+)
MIRSRRIPPLLSRICNDGIHSALLVTSDGELLGSYNEREDTTTTTTAPSSPSSSPPTQSTNNAIADQLDMAAIGALISEVAGDYLKLGNELQLLDGMAPPPPPLPPTPPVGQQRGGDPSSLGSSVSTNAGSTVTTSGKSGAAALKCLIVELDMGLVGVSSAGLDCYVVAMADKTVEYGLLKARLMTVSMYVAESLSQLVEQP